MNERRKQCKTCPWKVGASTDAIPDYDPALHRELDRTIAEPGDYRGILDSIHAMACHYSTEGAERPCVGWLHHQLGVGNNLALRFRAVTDPSLGNYELDGPQRERFEETLPAGASEVRSTKPRPPRRLRTVG